MSADELTVWRRTWATHRLTSGMMFNLCVSGNMSQLGDLLGPYGIDTVHCNTHITVLCNWNVTPLPLWRVRLVTFANSVSSFECLVQVGRERDGVSYCTTTLHLTCKMLGFNHLNPSIHILEGNISQERIAYFWACRFTRLAILGVGTMQ